MGNSWCRPMMDGWTSTCRTPERYSAKAGFMDQSIPGALTPLQWRLKNAIRNRYDSDLLPAPAGWSHGKDGFLEPLTRPRRNLDHRLRVHPARHDPRSLGRSSEGIAPAHLSGSLAI